ncbi:MAG: LytTR family DNA-binding domain-containing protein [Muribaculaceae bacterium]|nr:LytTR family DNA-binding domain-containing protein [Muribaculaceae bacterium]
MEINQEKNGKPLDCIIIEDETIARRGMTLLVSRNQLLNLRASFCNTEDAAAWLKENKIDLIFLDIEMPGVKGIDFAGKLNEETMVIFTTAYSEYAVESYTLNAVDYLLKPISKVRFDQAVFKALRRKEFLEKESLSKNSTDRGDSSLLIRVDRKNIPLNTKDIIYIEGIKDYVRIHTVSERYITRITFKSLLLQLPSTKFIRIHKSFIINIDFISSFNSTEIEMKRGEWKAILPIGEKYREDFIKEWS